MKPRFEILSQEEIIAIHEAGLTILEETGMAIDSKAVRDILCYNGAKQGKDNIIHFPKPMVEQAVAATKPPLVLGARDEKHAIFTNRRKSAVFSTTGFSPMVYDYLSDETRDAKMQDLIDFAKVSDFFDEIGFFLPLDVVSQETPFMSELEILYQCFLNTGKHIQCSCSSGKTAHYLGALGKIVAGSKETFQKQPLFSCNVMPISPLTLGKGAAEAIIALAEENVPIAPFSTPLANSSAPATIAGALALSNAENLGVLTIMKAVNKKSQMIYSTDTCVMDFHTGVINYDAPEYTLFAIANQQLADFYELTSCVAHESLEALPSSRDAVDLWKELISSNQMTGTALSLWLGSLDLGLTSSLLHLVYAVYLIREVEYFSREQFLDEDETLLQRVKRLSKGECDLSLQRQSELFLSRNHYLNPLAGIYDETILKNQLRQIIGEILEKHSVMPLTTEKRKAMDALRKEAKDDLREAGADK